MRDTCGQSSRSGWLITTGAVRTPAGSRGFLNPEEAFQRHKFRVTAFRVVAEWEEGLFWAVRITNTGWRRQRIKSVRKFKRARFFAEHTYKLGQCIGTTAGLPRPTCFAGDVKRAVPPFALQCLRMECVGFLPTLGTIVSGVFTPVLAKHAKAFSLLDAISVGVDRMQRNFEPMWKQVEAWQQSEVTDVSTKIIIYQTFIEGELLAGRNSVLGG